MTRSLGALAAVLRSLEPPPAEWSETDRARLEQLARISPDRLRFSADQLEQVAADLTTTGTALRAVASEQALGDGAVRRCAELADALAARATDASGLAHVVRRAATVWHELHAELLGALMRAIEGVGQVADRDSRLAQRQVEVLAGLRDMVDDATRTAAGNDQDWADDVAAPEITVTPEYSAWVGTIWHAATPVVRPEAGPVLAGTEGSRPETDVGVRVAQLPDLPG
ncbi:hypothetical protein [Pseudonocardia spinosispora]|uniref:hypothetical protein n=1 Tax=Pseudonocardia spinosispora TaxID=103441 RepID=UPI00040EB932|nr:hypothetical protein [Pseudonocardia spinosispora]